MEDEQGFERPRLTARDSPTTSAILCGEGQGLRKRPSTSDCQEILDKELEADGEREKTRHPAGTEGEFGWDIRSGECFPARTGQARIGYRPSRSIQRAVPKVHALTTNRTRRTLALVGKSEPHAARMGELLRGRNRQQGVSSARCLRGDAVAPVVALQAQRQAMQGRELSTLTHTSTGTSGSYV